MHAATGRLTILNRTATAIGVVAIAGALTLAIFFAGIPVFGPVNDVCGLLVAALSGVLVALTVRQQLVPRLAGLVGLTGAAIGVLGSVLVLVHLTGWFFAGLVSTVGLALLGVWLVVFSRRASGPPRWLVLGQVTGWLMTVGLVALPGVFLGLDDDRTAPAWIWVAYVSWIGTAAGYPAWALWLGRLRSAVGVAVALKGEA